MAKIREVEYYRLWSGGSDDSGTWDTAYIEIPPDTPDDQLEQAIHDATAKFTWSGEVPVAVGLYCDSDPIELEEEIAEPEEDVPHVVAE